MIVDGTMKVLLQVEDAHPVWSIGCGRICWQFFRGLGRPCHHVPLLGELCGFLPLRSLTSLRRYELPVRWSNSSTADCHLVRLSPTTSLLDLFVLIVECFVGGI